jgi:hypothetical protein
MFAQASANRLAPGGVHLALAPPMIAPPLVASLVVQFLIDKLEDVGVAGVAPLATAAAVRLIGGTQGARERLVEARA